MNPKRVGCFKQKRKFGVLKGFTRSSRKFEFSRVKIIFKRKPNSDVNQTLSNERNHEKKCNPEIKYLYSVN